jgi:SAM-dependent methyltransferase
VTAVDDQERLRRAMVFGEVAQRYHRLRPDYPARLVDDVLAHAGTVFHALEVGAGTGKATLPFAARGLAITAVEPDQGMAEVLRRNLDGNPLVTVEVRPFEEHTGGPYELLFSGQAWHWTDPDTRWDRAAALLAPGGTIALMWNDDQLADPDLRAAVAAVHEEHAPGTWQAEVRVTEAELYDHWPGTELRAHPAFGDHVGRLYAWERTLSMADYLAKQSTQSSYRILEPDVRHRLFDALAPLADQVALSMQSVVYLAGRT